MAIQTISASLLMAVPAVQVYRVIADYREGHPRILPRPPFVALTVLKGGVGAGTEITFDMKVMGQVQTSRATITEPEPGRTLVESNDNGIVTTFSVLPRDEDQQTYVTIRSDLPVRVGLLGKFEGWIMTQVLFPVYQRELVQLSQVAAGLGTETIKG